MVSEAISRRGFLRAAVGAAAVGVPVLSAACSSAEGATTLDEARKSGKLTVGFADEPPYSYTDKSGRLTGAGPEVVRAVLGALGVKELDGVLTDYRQLIGGLTTNRYSMIATPILINPDHCTDVQFTHPDFQSKSSFIVPKGNIKKITSYADVKKNKKVLVAVLTGAEEMAHLVQAGVPEEQIVTLGDQQSLYRAVFDQRVYAVATLDVTARYLLSQNKNTGLEQTPAFDPPKPNIGAYAFPKMESKFAAQFNAELDKLHSSGRWLEIVKPFGFTADNKPKSGLSTSELCKA